MVQVSIIIPVYNCEKYVKQAVESTLKQDYPNIEVIVIDDGSTDNTLNIITEFEHLNILIKPNGGTASALNLGIKRSSGDWIHWLSADDVLYENAITKMMENITSKDRIYYTNYNIIDETGTALRDFIEPEARNNKTFEERKDELLKYFYGNGSSSMIHRSVFDRIGYFDESLRYFEDYDFWLRAMKNGIDLWLIPIFTLKYRNHKEQLTNKADLGLVENVRSKYR